MNKPIIGVMGPGESPTERDLKFAYQLGQQIAKQNWILLTGGRNAGVMDAASKGTSEAGGLTVGILPGHHKNEASPYVDIPIVTGLGSARNNINVLTADIVIACGTGLGTTSEIMLALKAGRDVILLNQSKKALKFLNEFDLPNTHVCKSPRQAIKIVKSLL